MSGFLGVTHSACPACRTLVAARGETDGRDVYFRSFCPEHGEARHLVRRGVEEYLQAQRYVKPAWVPRAHAGDAAAPCPEGCGFCARHEQHLCLPIVEITSRCDLACPICIADAGGVETPDMTPGEFRRVLDGLLRAEARVDVLNLSGGEPLLHPHLLGLVDEALARPEILRVSVSTNGLRFLEDPGLLRALRARDAVVSLQFDGFDERAYRILRGAPLLEKKLRLLDLLAEEGVSTSLTLTAASGINDDQFPEVLRYLFGHEHVVSLMVQPLAFAGRASALAESLERLTLPDVVRAIGAAGHPGVAASDFVPLPCSHPLCFSLAFYLVPEEGDPVPVAGLVDADVLLDCLSNRVFFGLDGEEQARLRDLVYELWSGPAGAAPDTRAVLDTLRRVLRDLSASGHGPRRAFLLAERRIKSIFVHAFQDAATFDLARLRRCCNAYPQPDGRLLPCCYRNVLMGEGQP